MLQAEEHYKECLKIFKSINQTNTFAYIYVLKKYGQCLFYNKKYSETEKLLRASIEISKNVFNNSPELVFPYYRNLLAFFTYTDIDKASDFLDNEFNVNSQLFNKNVHKYITFATGPVKFLKGDNKAAKEYFNRTMGIDELPLDFQAFNFHNLATYNLEMKKDFDQYEMSGLSVEIFRNTNDYYDKKELREVENECFLLYKQALVKFEVNLIDNKDESNKILSTFLFSNLEVPQNISSIEDELLINSFKNKNSGLTITSISELFFEKGNEKEKV